MAVVTHLVRSVSDDLRSHWFLEVGFGPCAVPKVPEFNSLDEAQGWVLARVLAQRAGQAARP